MKRFFSALLAVTAITSSDVNADNINLQLGVGYRQDDIKWKIEQSDTSTPYVEDRVNFKDLDIFVIGAKARGTLGCSVYYRARFDYGFIFNGRAREKADWTVDQDTTNALERTIITGKAYNHAKKRYTIDFNLAVGYPFHFFCDELQLVPVIGFAYDSQRIRVNGNQQISDQLSVGQRAEAGINPSANPGHSKYRFAWWGPYLGLDLAWVSQDCWSIYSELEFHLARSRRERQSDTGDGFLDHYERTKEAYGFLFTVGASYMFCPCLNGDASFTYQDWKSTNSCSDKLTWRSVGIRFDLGYQF